MFTARRSIAEINGYDFKRADLVVYLGGSFGVGYPQHNEQILNNQKASFLFVAPVPTSYTVIKMACGLHTDSYFPEVWVNPEYPEQWFAIPGEVYNLNGTKFKCDAKYNFEVVQ